MVQAKIITHYRDLQETGTQIPDFMQVPPEKEFSCKMISFAVNLLYLRVYTI